MKIEDEFTDRTDLSRAMKCLLRKRRDGKCRTSGCHEQILRGGLCKKCAIELYHRRRKMRPDSQSYRCKTSLLIEEDAEG